MKDEALITAVLSHENMQLAWDQVSKKKGKPGADNWDVVRWNRNWEENIERLREQVLANTYQPHPPKRIHIRKKIGGIREICLFNVSDKVLQRAVLNILDDIFDEKFLGCSHAYRPRRSCATAVQQVLNFRDRGLHSIFEADIRSCFDNIDHSILMDRVKKWISDWNILHLMELWLFFGRKIKRRAVGIPQGAILSPLWCNTYLHPFDAQLSCTKWHLVRYADDFVILCESIEKARTAWEISETILDQLKLEFSDQKTGINSFAEGFIFLGVHFISDTFSYVHCDKHICVSGRDAKILFRNPPAFYE